MKPNPNSLKAALTAAALLCLSSADSWARPPRAREACGVVQTIDREARTLTLVPEKGTRPLVVVWKKDTKFLKSWNFESAAALGEGVRACVFYRSPFFGKPFVTKVVWINGS